MAKGLGRGLSAILSDVEESYVRDISKDSSLVRDIEVDEIILNPHQPRKTFNEQSIKELASSIEKQGLIQPIVVTEDDGEYILIAGERRLRAHKFLKKSTIKAIVVDFDLSKLREFAIIENLQREDLNVLDLAESLYELMQEHDYTHEELAKILSKSRSYITNILRLLKLSEYAKEKLKEDKINFGHAKSLVVLDEEEQKKAVDTIIGQKLSTRDAERLSWQYKQQKNSKKTKASQKKRLSEDEVIKMIEKKHKLKIGFEEGKIAISVTSEEDLQKIRKIFLL